MGGVCAVPGIEVDGAVAGHPASAELPGAAGQPASADFGGLDASSEEHAAMDTTPATSAASNTERRSIFMAASTARDTPALRGRGEIFPVTNPPRDAYLRHMKRRSRLGLVLIAWFVPAVADAEWTRSPDTPSVVFRAAGPAGLKIEGKTGELDLKVRDDTVIVTVPLGGLDTGIALRNRHMREKYLETAKYPSAVLAVPRGALALPADGATTSAEASGQMTIHGRTRPVVIRYRVTRTGSAYAVEGTVHVVMTDYGVSVPSYLGVTVKPDVDVVVSFRAVDT